MGDDRPSSNHKRRENSLRPDLIDRRFESIDGKLRLVVSRDEATLHTCVFELENGACLLAMADTKFFPHKDPSSNQTDVRLDSLQVELDPFGIGPTYRLFLARPKAPEELHGKSWLTVMPETPIEHIHLFPEYRGSPFWDHGLDWQEGWWYPYSKFRCVQLAEPAR